ncbi:uncharacterized protein LOC115535290 [Gadus morhua]|uniref:uncharacterized protein LOC115535290 n=1 Tax=Gadus morhua TaxID=8049 RepID=UPI0011B4F0B9|nr:uncharacterized protein LOC115535290 [Gadus morhua]
MRIRIPTRLRSPDRLTSVLLLELMVSWARAGAPPPVVVCAVGGRALLPCSWEEGGAHVEWRSRAPLETVYERWGEQTWAAPGFQGRLAMEPGALAAGDCSLELLDAQLLDGGEYDSYGLQGGGRLVRRVPLHSVRLSVHDHKLQRSVSVGEDLTLELITPQAQRVVFQERNGSSWGLLWQRGGAESPRLRRVPGREELVLTHPTPEDQGFYKVLDGHGLAVSTLLLSVRESLPVPEPHQDYREHNSPVGSTAVGPRPPGCIPLSLLLWTCALASGLTRS